MQKTKLKTLPPNAIFPSCFLISFTASTYSCTPDFVCIGPYRVFAEILKQHVLLMVTIWYLEEYLTNLRYKTKLWYNW